MIIHATCGFCKTKWKDEIPDRPNYEYGYSICEKCIEERKLQNIIDDKSTYCFNKLDDPHEFQLWSDLTRRDADKLRGCPCNWCSTKSTARIRRYNLEGDLRVVNVIAACDKHLKKLSKIAKCLEGISN